MSGFPPYRGRATRFKKRKSRFTFQEVQMMLNEVQRKRHILVGKHNRGISKDLKARTWAALTARINEISDCHREIIEVVKKWADLKCDTKRRVAALRSTGVTPAEIARELSPIETMVHQIIQMPVRNTAGASHFSPNDDDEDFSDLSVMPHSSAHLANSEPSSFCMPLSPQSDGPPLDVILSDNAAESPLNFEDEASEKKDANIKILKPVIQAEAKAASVVPFQSPPLTEKSPAEDKPISRTFNGPSASSFVPPSATPSSASSSSRSVSALLPSVDPHSLQESLAKNACRSLAEQQATTQLIGSMSRSLDSLAESVHRLVQAQQQFSRETLQMQRDALSLLRDFSSSALNLLQEKINSHS